MKTYKLIIALLLMVPFIACTAQPSKREVKSSDNNSDKIEAYYFHFTAIVAEFFIMLLSKLFAILFFLYYLSSLAFYFFHLITTEHEIIFLNQICLIPKCKIYKNFIFSTIANSN